MEFVKGIKCCDALDSRRLDSVTHILPVHMHFRCKQIN